MEKQTIYQWNQEVFNPWKQSMEDWKNKEKQFEHNIRRQAERLKYVVSLILEKKETEAVKVWNQMHLGLELVAMRVDLNANKVEMQPKGGQVLDLALDSLLADLQRLIQA